ncbi:hypothetical protein NW754_003135 [Fusarium falciforme]|nr:hypothetical protein NW754_003135 [Fusarium falciforme]
MVLFNIPKPAVPHGGWVVVTGVSGLVGSHVADQALRVGFRVRGTARSTETNAWVKEHFQSRYGVENFEQFEVPDMVAKGAFENVVAESERIFAVAGPVKSNAIIDILRRQFPQKGYKHVLDDEDDLVVYESVQRAEELLVEVYGTGFASLKRASRRMLPSW